MKYFYILSMLVLISIMIPKSVKADNLLSYPQKIVIDTKRTTLLVSNEGNGSLVKVDSAGNQSYFKYLDSLNVERHTGFIDGIEIIGDTIYGVGAGRKIYGYDLTTRKQVMSVKIPGSNGNYLSSITSDSTGHLFISCPPLHEIYKLRISDKTHQLFAKANGLISPNGILLEKEHNRIVVIGDAADSKIYSISLTDSTVNVLKTTTLYSPDGIVKDKFGTYYIGGYYLSGLNRIDHEFIQEPEMFFPGSHMVYPTYDPRDNSLLVTYYSTNNWGRINLNTNIENELKLKEPVLFQNYPNPFNNTTTISYVVPEGNDPVSLTLYNAKGELAARLLNKQVQAGGFYTVRINTNGLASGLYTCIYTFGSNKQEMQKLVLLK